MIHLALFHRNRFRLRVDRRDVIAFVDRNWIRFAEENDAPELRSVVGSNLLSHIDGTEERKLHMLLLERVRSTGQEAVYRFRCDSSGLRRFMEMRVVRLRSGEVEYRSRIVHSEAREPVRLLERSLPRSEEELAICSWCRLVRLEGRWLEADDPAVLSLLGGAAVPKISNEVCDACRGRFLRDLRPLSEVFRS